MSGASDLIRSEPVERLRLEGTKLRRAFELAIGGTPDFRGTLIKDDANLESTCFSGYAIFIKAGFAGSANFQGSNFDKAASFDGAAFSSYGCFSRAHLSSCGFIEAYFAGPARFDGAKIAEKADFERSQFLSEAIFTEASFDSSSSLLRSSFSCPAFFSEAQPGPISI